MNKVEDTKHNHTSRGSILKRAFFWGVISVAMYLAVFLNQDAVTRHFTKEGAFAIAVVVTALAFSFVHGSFANYVLDLSGIKPLQEENQQEGDH